MSYPDFSRQRSLLSAMFDGAPDALFMVDPDSELTVDCNPRAVALFEAGSAKALIGRPGPHLRVLPRDAQTRAALQAEVQRQGCWSREVPFITLEGRSFWGDLTVTSIHMGGCNVVLVRVDDITQRKQAEALLTDYNRTLEREVAERTAALENREELLQSLAHNVPGVIFRYAVYPDGRDALPYVSPGSLELWEVDPDEARRNVNTIWSCVHPADRPRLKALLEESASTLEPWHEEWRVTTTSGVHKWLQGSARPQRQPDGTMIWNGLIMDITERKRTELALARSEQQITDILASISDAFISLDQDWRFTYLNPRAEALLQRSAGALLGGNVWELFPEATRLEFHRQYHTAVATQQAVSFEEYFPPLERWFQVSAYPFESGLSVYFQDVSDRKRAEAALRDSEARYRLLAENMNDLVCLHDPDGRYRYLSPSCRHLLGYEPGELLGRDPYEFFHPEDRERIRQESHAAALASEPSRITYRFLCKAGEYLWLETLTQAIRGADGAITTLQTTSRDVEDRVRTEERLRFDALHDTLTGLANRTLLAERLELAIHRQSRQPGTHFAVLFLDLDRFKTINDSLGHQIGDHLLIAVARSLQGFVREVDLVARISGDEFAILLESLGNIDEAVQVAERIVVAFQQPFLLADREVFASTSIGIVLSSSHYRHGSELLRDADIAMYRAKTGSAPFEIFDPDMHAEALARVYLENDLRRALKEEALALYYQPIVSLTDGRITALEALVRWHHPRRGLVLPAEFIPVAEEIGLIGDLGLWVLREACRRMVRLATRVADAEGLSISVNLSPRQLREPDLVGQIVGILRDTGFPGSRLTLELTEGMLVVNAETVLALLHELRALGIGLSIDDFGTGYSSLSYLQRFPVTSLKIDQSFVSRMGAEPGNSEIAEVILALGRQLGLDVVAEGIETHTQLQRLKALGCPLGQGFLFSAPVAGAELEAFLMAESTLPC